MTGSHFFSYCGAHYKTCPVALREAWATVGTFDKLHEIIKNILQHSDFEFVLISTCNRFDLCFFGKITTLQIKQIFLTLHQLSLVTVNADLLNLNINNIFEFITVEFDENAIQKLFKVTASLDSLVLGEPQIFGQIKNAYQKAVELGFAGTLAGPIFNRCFKVTKKIRSDTDIGKNGISIGHAAIDAISRVFDNLAEKQILIFGAGEMARVVAQHLLFFKAKSVFIANRTFQHAEQLALELGNAWPLDLESALNRIHEFDISIAAASGAEFILHTNHLKNYPKKRQGKLSVFVDISIPRKIEPDIAKIENLFLFNIDDLDSIMEKNRASRKSAALLAEQMIHAEVQEYLFICKQKENLANVGRLHSWIKNVVDYELSRSLRDLQKGKEIDSQVVSDAVAKRLVSIAAHLAKNNIKTPNQEHSVGELLEFLFRLSEQPLLPEKNLKENNVLKFPSKHKINFK